MVHVKVDGMTIWNYREFWNVEEKWHDRLCWGYRADRDASHNGHLDIRGIPSCGTCKRTKIWLFFKCVNCDDYFIKDFNDPRFCSLLPHCWACLPELSWAYCPDHSIPMYRQYPERFPLREPVGLNPKKFTTEQLEQAGINVFKLSL